MNKHLTAKTLLTKKVTVKFSKETMKEIQDFSDELKGFSEESIRPTKLVIIRYAVYKLLDELHCLNGRSSYDLSEDELFKASLEMSTLQRFTEHRDLGKHSKYLPFWIQWYEVIKKKCGEGNNKERMQTQWLEKN